MELFERLEMRRELGEVDTDMVSLTQSDVGLLI